MDKIIIFKSDKVGDLINFSPCLKIIKDNIKESHITLVCSEYNFEVARMYSYVDKYVILDKGNILKSLFKNFKVFFFTKYKYLLQFDGKSISYLISYFIRSNIKSTICFVKYKKILNMSYKTSRPGRILLDLFYDNFIFCSEKYSSVTNGIPPVNYQTNYFRILEKLGYKITTRKNIFSLDEKFKHTYESFFLKIVNSKFSLFHFDEKWNYINFNDYRNCLQIIDKIALKNKLIITTGIKTFKFLNDLEKKFSVYTFANGEINLQTKKNINKPIILKNLPLNLLAYFISYSEKNISFHSGPIVHISPAFGKKVIDIIPKNKNDELIRWISDHTNYRRINFEDINSNFVENLRF